MSNKSEVAQNVISLPKGGGAIKGIGETFQPNLFSGTGNYSVPIATSPGRNGFGPTPSLQYSSGSGNGLFGSGWQLSIPRVTRKTEKGLPRYDESDTFVLSGAEDLVPCLRKVSDPMIGEDTWIPEDPINHAQHTIYRYRPRIEGLFARIERWEKDATREMHWRAITRNNVTNIYGATPSCRIADPEDGQRIFEWLLQESFDASGNHIVYEYARDNPQLYTNEEADLGFDAIFELNRKATQLYIRRICYGNLPDPLVGQDGVAITYPNGTQIGYRREGRRYAFEVVFDYGDWDIPSKDPHPDPTPEGQQELFGPDPAIGSTHNSIPIREDCFSNFRARFEIRTLRRCRRVLMFHHFAELGGPTLVRSTDFEYRTDPDTLLSFLTAVTVTGYRRDATVGYKSASMPPVAFEYSTFRPHEQRYKPVNVQGDDMPPAALNDPNVALIDLFGDGLPDVLQSSPAGFRYWRNLGDGLLDRPRSMPQIPAGIALAQPGVGFGDMGGDGQVDLLVHSGPLPGFFESTSEGAWQTFKPYEVFPSFDLADPRVRIVDLTGDGLPDALMTQEDNFLWFECLGERGFSSPRQIARKHDLDQFPDVFFNDPEARVRLADMTGDGLSDIVLIHNGRIDYWPNLGYGQFGNRITMENAPHLEADFAPNRLFLADLNGTGCADLVYVDFDRVHFWFNQCGNSWSDTETILGTPPVSDVDSIQFADVFGTGTATLLWSYEFSAQPESNYKALDFCGGVKPYLLTKMSNNMGATTRVSYAPSTQYFLEDQANGTPWITRLPFPVQVVNKVEVIDHISKTKLVTTYKYHHGYFDGREREFRGFGRVDQFDTETFEDFTRAGLHGDDIAFNNNSAAYHAPPVETRSWFHTGIYFDEGSATEDSAPFDYEELTKRFRREFYQRDVEAFALDEHQVHTEGAPHEAYRALRGAPLRTEVYAHDGTPTEHPYQVSEYRHHVAALQPKGKNHKAVYFRHLLESLTFRYERVPNDPRTSHALTLEVDAFGNVLRSIAIAHGRRRPDPTLPTEADRHKQTRTFITYSEHRYTNAIDDPVVDLDNYRTPLPSETLTYELTGLEPPINATQFGFDEWVQNDFALLEQTPEINFEETADTSKRQKRLIEHVRTLYRKDDLSEFLPLGALQSRALQGETYKLAFTPSLLLDAFANRVADSMLANDGGYVHNEADANWWIPSGRVFYSPHVADTPAEELTFAQQHFFLPHRSSDPFGSTAFLSYDTYNLLLRKTEDPLSNRTTAEQDYRLLQPFRVIDVNGNRSEAAFDTLGLVAGTAMMGKETESQGDSLSDFVPDLAPQQREDFLTDPLGNAVFLLGSASTRIVYDLDRYRTARQPIYTAVLARETHVSDPLPPDGLKVQVSFSYLDGIGREIQKKVQAEPGPVVEAGPAISPRWVGSGSTIFDNKGRPVKQYEGFFDDTHQFLLDRQEGVSSTLFYDPLARVVTTLHPNHTWEKVVLDAWKEEKWDVNDTIAVVDPTTDPDVGDFFRSLTETEYLPAWITPRQDGSLGPHEQSAAAGAAIHSATPSVSYVDALGQTFLAVAHNRFERSGSIIEEKYSIRTAFDIEGNQLEVVDGKDRVVMRYKYDVLGTRICQTSLEAGERWTLNDITGRPIYTWNSRDHQFRSTYDSLRRPLDVFLSEGSQAEQLISRTIYGESQADASANNLRGRVVRLFDQAGVVTTEDYDFKGNLLTSRRQFAKAYKTKLNWLVDPELEPETFLSRTTYDAINRPLSIVSPDEGIYRPIFNEANLLEKVDVQLHGTQVGTPFVTNIDYNARGQRVLVEYGNSVKTTYEYDPLTFRLAHLKTFRGTECLQDLSYTFDPLGNITHVQDDAQQAIYFNNQVVTASNDYVYDAIYRLITAHGREHIGQTSTPQTTWDDRFRVNLPHPQDGMAMRQYTEQYHYSAAGNFERLIHQSANGDWTRDYTYNEASLIQPGETSNRLTTSVVGQTVEHYNYDPHGNVISMPHLSAMQWDYRDQLEHVDLGGGGSVYYVYDAGGQRVRKVVEKNGGALVEERIYLGSFEIFRRRNGSGAITLERETLHIMDNSQRLALVETRTRGSDNSPAQLFRYQLTNHLGSASLELDGQAQIISYEEYYPYGSTSYQAVRSQTEAPKRYRYAGLERDEETGFNYHGARYYAPWIGRWLSCDPAGMKDRPNLYEYCAENPVCKRDRIGTDDEWCILCNPFSDDVEFSPLEFTEKEVVPRVVGGVKVVAGGVGFVIGAGLCETGLGCVIGGPLMVASADVGGSGAVQVWSGDPEPTALGTLAGPKAQEIEENFVNAAGWATLAAQGYTMWQTGTKMQWNPYATAPKSEPNVCTTSQQTGTAFKTDPALSTAGSRYKTTPMLTRYEGEHLPNNTIWGSAVKYLDQSARQAYRLVIKDGKIYDAKGKLFDTAAAATAHQGGQGRAIFVMDEYGNFYASKTHAQGKFHHSSLLAGDPVAAAGEIQVVKGKLELITDTSGHYWPGKEFTNQALDALKKAGVDVSNVQVKTH